MIKTKKRMIILNKMIKKMYPKKSQYPFKNLKLYPNIFMISKPSLKYVNRIIQLKKNDLYLIYFKIIKFIFLFR